MERNVAIVLAGGTGSRMKSDIPKQYLLIDDKPVLWYSLDTFEKSFVDDIILVAGHEYVDFCRREIVDKYGFNKVRAVVEGGKERYDSVFAGLKAAGELCAFCDAYVYIHDGARACITSELLLSCRDCVIKYNSAVPGVPVKDTIKVVDSFGFVDSTPDRKSLMAVQTPQVFLYSQLRAAYEKMYSRLNEEPGLQITDDAMVMETFSDVKVRICPGSDENIKLTTPADLELAKNILKKCKNCC